MFGIAPMKNPASGNRLAIGVLLLGTIWMALRISGLFRAGPVHFPSWAGYLVALGIPTGLAIAAFAQGLSRVIRLIAAAVFLVCLFVFPWFYQQFPIFYWLTLVLLYVEVFWFIPFYLKRHRSSRRDT